MANPFLRRATEYIRDDTTFLEIVSPAPLTTFLAEHPRKADIFDLPIRIVGAPGDLVDVCDRPASGEAGDEDRGCQAETHRG